MLHSPKYKYVSSYICNSMYTYNVNMYVTYILFLHGEVSAEFPTCREEVDAYFTEKPVSREVNPLVWWKENSSRYLRMAKVAHSLLSIPATSAPAERIFSNPGLGHAN